MKVVKWGVLSTARIGVEHVIPAIRAIPGCEVSAIASRDGRRAEQAAADLAIPRAFGSYEELLDDDTIDCVYIPLPNALHADWAVRALERGRAVLVEKPLACGGDDARRMAEAAERSGALLAEAFMYRYHEQFKRVLRYVEDGTLGRVRVVRGAINFRLDDGPDIRLRGELGGGALLDVGCYPLDAMCLLFGSAPTRVQATGTRRGDVDGMCAGLLEFEGGGIGLVDCNFELPWLQAPLEVVGEHGTVRLENAYNPGTGDCRGTLLVEGREPENFVVPGMNMYGALVSSFADSVRTGSRPEYSVEASLATAHAIDLMRGALPLTAGAS
ncbi:Gfo/Idh/MocA family oxidoreductase [Streptomyces anulatus]|uniref:Gfo/Idh/MocA family protein n=1 Tax=Streptomyces anulatus TaxID=1892 RepID=UPI00341B3ACD